MKKLPRQLFVKLENPDQPTEQFWSAEPRIDELLIPDDERVEVGVYELVRVVRATRKLEVVTTTRRKAA